MLEELSIREFKTLKWKDVLMFCRHIGFEEWSLKNIDAVLKGNEPLTSVNKHLLVTKTKALL